MRYSTATNTVHITMEELFRLSDRYGSVGRREELFLRPRAAQNMLDTAAGDISGSMQYAKAVAKLEYHGVKYEITAICELLVELGNKTEIRAYRATGGTVTLDEEFAVREANRLAAICGAFWRAGIENPEGLLFINYQYNKPTELVRLNMSGLEMYDTLLKLIKKASDFISFEIERQTVRIPNSASAKFPYPSKREGQSDFMNGVYLAIKREERIMLEAPTGIGKTVSALFPSVRALGYGYTNKIFYLTPKTTTQYAATEALKAISAQKLMLRSIAFSAKDKLCVRVENSSSLPHIERKCETCPRGYRHEERVGDAILYLLNNTRFITKDEIAKAAEKFSVCPYELSLDVSEYCDIIICDCNYLLDSRVYFRRYFENEKGSRSLSSCIERDRYAFVCDEAHNLPERTKSMYSHTLRADRICDALSAFGMSEKETEARLALNDLYERLISFRKLLNENVQINEKNEQYAYAIGELLDAKVADTAAEFCRICEEIRKERQIKLSDLALDTYFDLKDFLSKAAYYSKKFKCIIERYGESIYYRMLCLDPSDIIAGRLDSGVSSALFSATFTPMDYYSKLLGCETAHKLVLESPYRRENLDLLVFDRLSTKYQNRQNTAIELAEIIKATVKAQTGNYIVYFPSYNYLKQIYALFSELCPDVDTIVQSRNMSEQEKEAFITRFDPDPKTTLVGFCVLGGIFAEGIDLVGKRLIGSIIVGVGMPRLSLERDLLAEYYGSDVNENGVADGFLYSYVYPGMTRVLQAAGRVIRTDTDRGVVVLLDERFSDPTYKRLFPQHWRHAKFIVHPRTLEKRLKAFWNEQQ